MFLTHTPRTLSLRLDKHGMTDVLFCVLFSLLKTAKQKYKYTTLKI
jgi:RNA:NAD 2'-phosphotransferase (TPT1/KptA family)